MIRSPKTNDHEIMIGPPAIRTHGRVTSPRLPKHDLVLDQKSEASSEAPAWDPPVSVLAGPQAAATCTAASDPGESLVASVSEVGCICMSCARQCAPPQLVRTSKFLNKLDAVA